MVTFADNQRTVPVNPRGVTPTIENEIPFSTICRLVTVGVAAKPAAPEIVIEHCHKVRIRVVAVLAIEQASKNRPHAEH
jgi:hypothetical protein